LLPSSLVPKWTLKLKAASSSEMLVSIHKTKCYHSPEDIYLNFHCYENLRAYIELFWHTLEDIQTEFCHHHSPPPPPSSFLVQANKPVPTSHIHSVFSRASLVSASRIRDCWCHNSEDLTLKGIQTQF
jgi:hypothetical protein